MILSAFADSLDLSQFVSWRDSHETQFRGTVCAGGCSK